MRSRVLHLVYSFYHGGAEHLIGTLLSAMDRERYEHSLCVLTAGGQPLEDLESSGASVSVLGKKQGADLLFLPELIAHIRKAAPDIIDLHNNSAAMWGTAAVVAGRLKIPVVRTEHRPWIPDDLPFFHRNAYRHFARRAGRIIAVSDHARQTYLSAFPELAGKLVTVHNGIDAERFGSPGTREACREWFGLPGNAFIIGTVGRLVPIKNQRLLLDAFAEIRKKIPGAHLAILGQGPLEGVLRRRASELGCARDLSILPASPSVPRFMGALDLFTLTSDSEGLPLTLLEACASALPVVATSVGGIPEVVENGSNGILISRGDIASLIKIISDLAGAPDVRTGLGAAAKKTALSGFTAQICATRTSEVFDAVLKGPRK